MRDWILRGLVFAAVMVVLRLFQGAAINAWQTQSALISVGLLILFVIGVVLWGGRDGHADATANPDPDRRRDLAMTWLLAGLVAGVVSGAVSWLISSLGYKDIYTGGLLNEVTTFAAFTALLVFLPGVVGAAIGRWRVDRQLEKVPVRHHGLAAEHERGADSDVFSAVRGDDSPTGELPVQRTAVATAEREAPTETTATTRRHEARSQTFGTSESEAPTESFNLPGREDKTEVIRTRDADETKPDTPKKDPGPSRWSTSG